MSGGRWKRVTKRVLKRGYQTFGWVLPGRVRRELQGYRQFRRTGGRPPTRPSPPAPPPPGPYWERRERPGQNPPPVRVGLIGAGQYAQHHLKVLADLENVSVAALLTTGGPRGRETAERYHIPVLTQDREQFFARDDIDCFLVVASAEHVYSLTMDGLATGKPVLLEKPPGATAAETGRLVEQAQAHSTFGMVCMNRRFYSVIEHGLAQLAQFGPIRGAMVEVPHKFTADRQSGRLSAWDYGHFYVRNSIHGIDLLRYVLGDPQSVDSADWPNAEYDYAAASYSALLRYERGVVASVVDLWDTPARWRLKVVAEGGYIEYEPLEMGWYLDASNTKIPLRPDPVDTAYRPGIYAQDLHFIEAVRRHVIPARPACLLPEAQRTMLLIEKILASNLSRVPVENQTWHAMGPQAEGSQAR
jgi:predicted dehydrogenase